MADGVVKVMLLGQNVNSYGKNLEEPISFAQLLERVEQIDGLKRIRFMTSHPKDLSDELIEVMAKSKKICRHLHLPMQSGSTKVLTDMNRRYTKEDYLTLVDKIKTAMPDISLTTDIIVGFPTETEIKDRFNRLLKEVQEIAGEVCGRDEGKTMEVLVEGLDEQDESLLTGRLSNNILVHFPGDKEMIGTFQQVKLLESKGFYYLGERENA